MEGPGQGMQRRSVGRPSGVAPFAPQVTQWLREDSALSSVEILRLNINGGTIDNTSAGAIAASTNNAQSWGGSFTFIGTQSLNLGAGGVTLNSTPTFAARAPRQHSRSLESTSFLETGPT